MAETPTATQLHARAKELANAGNLPAAEALLNEALTLAIGAAELSLVDGTLAYLEAEQGRVADAEQRCLDALKRHGLSAISVAVLRGQLGFVRWIEGRTAEAVDLFTEAIDGLGAATDPDQRTTLLANRGTARMELADFEGAWADLTAALDGSDPVVVAKCRHNLGYLHLLRGDLVEALQQMNEARKVLATLGPAVTATVDIDRAEALGAAALPGEAIGLLRAVRRRLDGSDLWRIQADVEARLASLLSGPEAIALAEAAAQRYAEHGNNVDADLARATALHLEARSAPTPPHQTLTEVAERLAEAGRADAARALRVRAAGLRGEFPEPVPDTAPLATHLLAGEVAARVALGRHDLAEALHRAGSALDELETWQRSIGSLELQSSTQRHGEQVIRLGQQAALASADPEALLQWSERARELVARSVPERPPEELGDRLAALRHLGPDGDPAARARLIEEIRHGRWQAGGSVSPAKTLTLSALRSALGSARFVSILEVDRAVIALSVATDSVEVHHLGDWDELRHRLGGLHADLTMAARHDLAVIRAGLAERLDGIDSVLAPAWAGAQHLVLTVPDELSRMPWGQLGSLAGVAVSLPTSATSWVRAAQTAPRSLDARTVLVGPGTRTGLDEAKGVHDAWRSAAPGGATVHDDATCPAAASLAARSDLLHLCAHGHDRDAHPLLASVQLADGAWFGHDVELLASTPDLVVLSACGVGGGSLGMARAWLHAGARHVIAAPADISEDAAAERFPRLHARLAAGVSPALAVAETFGAGALDCAVQCYGPS
ncbi:CHAT domain-containing protein [Nocardioides limicola]|uniref:CHAT domain-containing protein n=1 Tax=Nocardioides limicola TaxID=2803368 RepID=UPI00193AFBD2|nr:CHAT domain-containing protein [Nocardioides sp. DJM-14]